MFIQIKDNIDKINYKYDFPALMLTGRQDASVGYYDQWNILENYNRASFIVLDKAGHN